MSATSGEVAVIGAGVAGASCSAQLAKEGRPVSIFDMGGRGPGGRTSTRRQSGYQFDHGCSYIQSPGEGELQSLFELWQNEGALAEWSGSFGILDAEKGSWQREQGRKLLVGTPSMDALVRHLSEQEGIQQHWAFKVQRLEKLEDGQWLVHGLQRHPGDQSDDPQTKGPFSTVLLADCLTFQPGGVGSVELGSAAAESLLHPVGKVIKKSPRFSLMAALHVNAADAGISAASVAHSDTLEWFTCDTSKPGRSRSDGKSCWVAVSTEAFAKEQMASSGGKPDMGAITEKLLKQLRSSLQVINPRLSDSQLESSFTSAQRWGSGFKANCHPKVYIWDAGLQIGATGDFCVASSALQAIKNGLALADAVVGKAKAGDASSQPASTAPGDMLQWA